MSPRPGERIEPQQAGAASLRRAAAHRFKQALGHAGRKGTGVAFGKNCAGLELKPERRANPAARFFKPHDSPLLVENDQPGADVKRGDVDDLAIGANRDFCGTAADIHIHHRRAIADRTCGRAGAVCGHHRFQTVAGADCNQTTGLAREQFPDASRIAPPHRNAGQNERAGIDLLGIDFGVAVLPLDKRAERLGVDRLLRRVGRDQDVGLKKAFALGDDIAAVEPLQHNAREYEMRGRRSDVDPDRKHA